MPHVIGVDVGGTKIEAILYDGKKVLHTVRIPTEAHRTYKHVLHNILTAIDSVRSKQVEAVGLATPGHSLDGQLFSTPNNPSLEQKRLLRDVQRAQRIPVVHENDAKCFAIAETQLGAAKHKQHVIGVVIGTGIGGGIITNGRIYHGALGAAGEIGHMPYHGSEYERFGSGPGIHRLYLEAGGKQLQTGGDVLRAKRGRNKQEHAAIMRAQNECYDALGQLSAALINALNPQMIVYGGGVSKSLDYRRLRRETKKHAIPAPFTACKQVKHKLSDSAGSVGAALLALDALGISRT